MHIPHRSAWFGSRLHSDSSFLLVQTWRLRQWGFPPSQGTRTEFLAPGLSHCPAQAVAGIFGKNQRTGTLCLSVSPPCVCLTASQIKFLKKEKQGQLGGGSVRVEVPPLGVSVHYNGTRNSNCIFPGLQGPSHLCIAQSWLHRNP